MPVCSLPCSDGLSQTCDNNNACLEIAVWKSLRHERYDVKILKSHILPFPGLDQKGLTLKVALLDSASLCAAAQWQASDTLSLLRFHHR